MTFNINHIISKYNLDESKLSEELFPTNKYPKIALARITSGEAHLNTIQLDMLANICGISIQNLFMSENWNMDKNVSNIITFYKNDHRVELDIDTLISKIYCGDKLIAKETLISDKNIKLSEYLKLVDKTIINLI